MGDILLIPLILVAMAYFFCMPLLNYALSVLNRKEKNEWVSVIPSVSKRKRQALLGAYYTSVFLSWLSIIYLIIQVII